MDHINIDLLWLLPLLTITADLNTLAEALQIAVIEYGSRGLSWVHAVPRSIKARQFITGRGMENIIFKRKKHYDPLSAYLLTAMKDVKMPGLSWPGICFQAIIDHFGRLSFVMTSTPVST